MPPRTICDGFVSFRQVHHCGKCSTSLSARVRRHEGDAAIGRGSRVRFGATAGPKGPPAASGPSGPSRSPTVNGGDGDATRLTTKLTLAESLIEKDFPNSLRSHELEMGSKHLLRPQILQEPIAGIRMSGPWLLRKLFDILRCVVLKSDSIDPNQCPTVFLLFSWKLVGIPKRASDESRPIAVSSIILRCWNKAVLKVLPPLPADQWAGRKETSVAHATADWLAHPGQCGAEIDLQKAFDSVNWGCR